MSTAPSTRSSLPRWLRVEARTLEALDLAVTRMCEANDAAELIAELQHVREVLGAALRTALAGQETPTA